jgi:t-SNARE complex subunit (syntaxin)
MTASSLTTVGTGDTNPAAGHRRNRRRAMWRMSSIEVVIFIAVVTVAVALLLA